MTSIVDVLEKMIEELSLITSNPTYPNLGVEKKFGIQRSYYEQTPSSENVSETQEIGNVPRERVIEVEKPSSSVRLIDKTDAYTIGLDFESSINRSKNLLPSSLSTLDPVEAEALIRNKMFDFLEGLSLFASDISVSYEPTEFAVKIEVEGYTFILYYYDVSNTWKLFNAEVVE